jgi:formylglycine-generating enzyme
MKPMLLMLIGMLLTGSSLSQTRLSISKSTGNSDAPVSSRTKSTAFKTSSNGLDVIPAGMVGVTGGTFQMGSNDPLDFGASPPHTVTLDSFYIDNCEITYEKWTEVRSWAMANGYASTDIAVGQNGFSPNNTNNPVTEVNWYDVLKWCNARSEKDGLTPAYYTSNTLATVYRAGQLDLAADAVKWAGNGYRLPTEAEWEFAARGGMKTNNYVYSGSDSIAYVAWYLTNSGDMTHQVGTKSPNELGIYDMSGNVFEWCWDFYGAYSSGAQTNPTGPASSIYNYRVLRGGMFYSTDYVCRVAARYINGSTVVPGGRYYYAGFRCTIAPAIALSVPDQMPLTIPKEFEVFNNFPNPFNPSTTIRYGMPARSHVSLAVFNALGQQVAVLQDGDQEAGYHEVRFDGSRLASGVYFYRLQAGDFVATKRLLLLK